MPVPPDLRAATAESRNDWLYREKRFAERAARGNCDLLFLGGTQLALWDRVGPLFTKEYGPYRPLNGSIWGQRTENILWQIDNGGLDGLQPKLVVLHMQDPLDNISAPAVAAGMGAIVGRLRQKMPGAKLLLLGAFPREKARPIPAARRSPTTTLCSPPWQTASRSSIWISARSSSLPTASWKEAPPRPDGYDPKSLPALGRPLARHNCRLMNQP